MNELPAPRLTCREVVALLTDYLEGALPASERERVDAHLHMCPDCRAYVEQTRATIGALGRLREADVPPAILGELAETFRDWRAG